MMFRHIAWCFLICVMGCDTGPRILPVNGTVTYNGEPLAVGGITFEPFDGRSAFGTIENGSIVNVTTHARGDGVLEGACRVGVQATTNLGQPVGPHDPLIPARYFDPQSSGIVLEISRDSAQQLSIELNGPSG